MIATNDVRGTRTIANGIIFPQSATLRSSSVNVWNSPAGGAQAGDDSCDTVTISEDTVALTLGDVSGHGAAAAEMMAAMRASMLRTIHELCVPSARPVRKTYCAMASAAST